MNYSYKSSWSLPAPYVKSKCNLIPVGLWMSIDTLAGACGILRIWSGLIISFRMGRDVIEIIFYLNRNKCSLGWFKSSLIKLIRLDWLQERICSQFYMVWDTAEENVYTLFDWGIDSTDKAEAEGQRDMCNWKGIDLWFTYTNTAINLDDIHGTVVVTKMHQIPSDSNLGWGNQTN